MSPIDIKQLFSLSNFVTLIIYHKLDLKFGRLDGEEVISTGRLVRKSAKNSDEYLLAIIPVEATRLLNLKPGQKIMYVKNGNRLIMVPSSNVQQNSTSSTKLSEVEVKPSSKSLALVSEHSLQDAEIH